MQRLIFIAFLLWLACTKTPPPEEPVTIPPPSEHIIDLGKASVIRNGVSWDAPFRAYYHNNKDRIGIKGMLKLAGFDHEFTISDISGKTGFQKMERVHYLYANNGVPNPFYAVILDQDQVINLYNLDTTLSTHFIEILHFDSVANVVEGRFQTTLEGPNTWSFLPDTMKMTEGKFHLKIE